MTYCALLVRQEDAIWLEQGEDELERALQVSMDAIVGKVMLTLSERLFPGDPNPHYLVERKLFAVRHLKYTGGFAESPRHCSFSAFPFRRIGSLLVQLGQRVDSL